MDHTHLLAASRFGLDMDRLFSPEGVPFGSGSPRPSEGACPVSLLLLRGGMPLRG